MTPTSDSFSDLLDIPAFLRVGSAEHQAAVDAGRRIREEHKRGPTPQPEVEDLLS